MQLLETRRIRNFGYGLLAAFTWGKGSEWWLYGPISRVLGLLALVVAGSDGAWPWFSPATPTMDGAGDRTGESRAPA